MEPQERYPANTAAVDTADAAAVVAAGGNEHVDSALRELAAVGALPLHEQPDVFGRVHAALQQTLSEIDDL